MADETPTVQETVEARTAREALGNLEPRSADALTVEILEKLRSDPTFAEKVAEAPQLLKKLADAAKIKTDAELIRNGDLLVAKSNGTLYLTVVLFVGFALTGVVVSIAWIALAQLAKYPDITIDKLATQLPAINIVIPDGLIALGSAAIGALAGLLTPLVARR